MSRIVGLANPEYAAAGGMVPVRTAAAMASTEAARMEKAPTTTETIAEAKIAKSRHAGAVRPAGSGQNQIAAARASVASRAMIVRRSAPPPMTRLPCDH